MNQITKEKIIKSIEESDMYSRAQIKILKEMILVSNDYLVTISPKYLHTKVDVSIPAIYTALKNLQSNNTITKIPNVKNTYEFNKENIEYILKINSNKN